MNNRQTEFTTPALGRSAFLGQIYNGHTDQLLNTQLFNQQDLAENIREEIFASTSYSFTDVRGQSDRSKALHISGELSVSILCGLVSLTGSGEYVDNSKSHVSSHEISATCTVQKKSTRLEVGQCVDQEQWLRLRALGATHVVTGIRYGGTLVANVSLNHSVSESDKLIKGSLSVSLMKGMILCYAEGKVSAEVYETAKAINRSCNFKVYGDWVSGDGEELPTTIEEVIQLIKKWPSLVGEGVPCAITLSPIAQFVDSSPETMVIHELEQHKLMSICHAYDEFFRLSGRRAKLVSLLNGGIGPYCPTFETLCRDRKLTVDGAVGRAREELSRYVVAFRRHGPRDPHGVEELIARIKKEFNDALAAYKQDEATLDLLTSIRDLAAAQYAPLASIKELQNFVAQVGDAAVGVVIIPPSPNLSNASNTFNLLVQGIRSWREEEDKKEKNADGSTPKTRFSAFYADPEFDSEFLNLDAKRGALWRALEQAKMSGESRFLHYGLLPSPSVLKEFGWCLLNEQGWGFLASQTENFFYVGQVKDLKRHGRGAITYGDGSVYTGDWWQDKRHGEGKLVEPDGDHETSGVFIDNIYRADGVVVKLTIFSKEQVPLASYKVPLRKYDSTSSHVLRMGEMLGWVDRDEFHLEVVSKAIQPLNVEVKGKLLMPGSDERLSISSWPFDHGPLEVKATIL